MKEGFFWEPIPDPWEPGEDGLELEEPRSQDSLYNLWLGSQGGEGGGSQSFNPAFDAYRPSNEDWDSKHEYEEYYTCERCGVLQRGSLFPRAESGDRDETCTACREGKVLNQDVRTRKRQPYIRARVPSLSENVPALKWKRASEDFPGILLVQVDGPLGLGLIEMFAHELESEPMPMHLQIEDIDDCWFLVTTDVREALETVGMKRVIATGQTEGVRGITKPGHWYKYILVSLGT